MSLYFEEGYVNQGYCEGDNTNIITQDNIVYNINTSFVMDNGVNITDNISDWVFVKEDGKFYHTLSFRIHNINLDTYLMNLSKKLTFSIDTETHHFIVVDIETNHQNVSFVICKTMGVILDKPFSNNKQTSNLKNSNAIIAQLMSNLSYTDNTPIFTFNDGNFSNEGTIMSGLTKLLEVSGSTVRVVNDTIQLDKILTVDSNSAKFAITDDVIFSKDVSYTRSSNRLLNTVIFNSSNINMISDVSITIDYNSNDKTDIPRLFFNPIPKNSNEIVSNLGKIFLHNEVIQQVIKTTPTHSINTYGGIISIKSIIVNGWLVDSTKYQYENEYNLIYFDDEISGTVVVEYETKYSQYYEFFGVFNDTYNYNVLYKGQVLDVDISQDLQEYVNTPLVKLTGDVSTLAPITMLIKHSLFYKIDLYLHDHSLPTDEIEPWLINHGITADQFTQHFTNDLVDVENTSKVKITNMSLNIRGYNGNNLVGFILPKDVNLVYCNVHGVRVNLSKQINDDCNIYYFPSTEYNLNTATIYTKYSANKIVIPASAPVEYRDVYPEDSLILTSTKFYKYNTHIESLGVTLLNNQYAYINYATKKPTLFLGHGEIEIVDKKNDLDTIPMYKEIDVVGMLQVDISKAIGVELNYKGTLYKIDESGKINIYISDRSNAIIDTSMILLESFITVDSTSKCGIIDVPRES